MKSRNFAFLLVLVVSVSSFAALVSGDEGGKRKLITADYTLADLPIWRGPIQGEHAFDASVVIALIKSKVAGVDIQHFETNLSLVIHGTQEAHEQVADVLKSLRRPVASPVSAANSPRTERVVSSPMETATAREATVTIQKAGPKQLKVGQYGDFFLFVKNAGDTPLTGLQVVDEYSTEFRPVGTDPPAARIERGRIVWFLQQLDPGQTQVFHAKCEALFDVRQACSLGTVRGPDGLERADQVCLPILPDDGEPASEEAESTAPYLEPAPTEKTALDRQPSASGHYQLIGESGWVYRIDTATGEVVGMQVGEQAWSRLVRVIEVTSKEPVRTDPGFAPWKRAKPTSEAPTDLNSPSASPQ